jgi:hypothetical protein
MAFYNKDNHGKPFQGQKNFHAKPHVNHHPNVAPVQGKQITKPPLAPLPERVYRDDELHIDVVDLSFNDIRKVETGTYPDGLPIVEYLSEKQATERGFLTQWQGAQPIEEYRKTDRD